MKKWVVITAAVGALAAAGAIWAGPGAGRGARGAGAVAGGPPAPVGEWGTVWEQAGLTSEQVEALRDLRYEHEKEIIPLRADRDLARLEVRRLLAQEKPDEASVMKAVEAAGQAEVALRKARIRHQLQVRSVLGPEASARLRAACHEAWGGRRREPMGERRWRDRGRFEGRRGPHGLPRWQHGPPREWDEDRPESDEAPLEE